MAIYDLVGQSLIALNDEATPWTLSSTGASGGKTNTVAQGTYMGASVGPFFVVGGPLVLGPISGNGAGQYFERIYRGLVPHTTLTLYLQMFFWGAPFDSVANAYSFYIDNMMIAQAYLSNYYSSVFPSLQLGRHLIKATIPHTADSATLKIMYLLSYTSNTASFGFNNVTIHLSNATTSLSLCQTSMDSTTTAPYLGCSCMTYSGNNYLFNQVLANGGCTTCATNCKVCYGTASSECMACNSGYIWIGDLCWDGICSSLCSSCFGPSNHQCSTCQTGYYNYGNGTCSSVCLSSYYIINNSSGLYCLITCSSPLYPITHANGVSYCGNFCSDSEPNYYPAYNVCKSSCEYPYNLVNNICSYKLSSTEEATAAGLSSYMSTINQISFTTTAVSTLIFLSNPSSVCLISLSKLLFYIRYMDIEYPPLLQTILDEQKTSSDGFIFFESILEDIISENPNKMLPWNFRKYNLYSTFLISFWTPLFFTFLIIIAILICLLIELALKKKPTYLEKFRKFQRLLMWDLFISRFMTYYDGIILYSSLEFRTIEFGTSASIISFLVTLIMIGITVAIPARLFHIFYKMHTIYKQYRYNNSHSQVRKFENGYMGYSGVFEDFLKKSVLQQGFVCVYLIRMYLFYIVISYLYISPIAQAIINILLNFAMIAYIIKVRPFRQKWNRNQYIMQEVVVTIINICIFILAILDLQDAESAGFRNALGWIIIVFNIIFSAIGITVIVIVIVIQAKEYYKIIKEMMRKRKELAATKLNESSMSVINNHSNVIASKKIVNPRKAHRKGLEDTESFSTSKHYNQSSLNNSSFLSKPDGSGNDLVHELCNRKPRLKSKHRKANNLSKDKRDSGNNETVSSARVRKHNLATNGNEKKEWKLKVINSSRK